MRGIALVLGALALAMSGCRPPLGRLTKQRAYDQALCSVHGWPDPASKLDGLAERIDADARPRLHLHAVPRAELERSLGEAGRRLADHAVLVRAVVAIDGVQVDDFGLRVALLGPQGPIASQPASVEVLAGLVGETIPAAEIDHVEGSRAFVPQRFRERPILGMAAVLVEASTLFLVPATLVTGHSRSEPDRTIYTPPSNAAVLAAAPVASMVAAEAARLGHVEHGDGYEVASVWLWPRPPAGDLRLVVEWSYAAYGCAGRKPALKRRPLGDSQVTRTEVLSLRPGDDLESRLNAMFGAHMHSLVP